MHNPLTSYRFLLAEGRSHPRWLNGSGVHRRDVTDAHDFRRQHRAPDAGLGARRRRPAGLPRPVRPLGCLGDHRATPDWADRSSTGPRPVAKRREVPMGPQLYGGDSRRDHRAPGPRPVGFRRRRPLPDSDVLPPRDRPIATTRRASTGWTRCSAATRRWTRLVEAAHARGIRVIGDLTTNHTGSRARVVPSGAGRPGKSVERRVLQLPVAPRRLRALAGPPLTLPKLDWRSVHRCP